MDSPTGKIQHTFSLLIVSPLYFVFWSHQIREYSYVQSFDGQPATLFLICLYLVFVFVFRICIVYFYLFVFSFCICNCHLQSFDGLTLASTPSNSLTRLSYRFLRVSPRTLTKSALRRMKCTNLRERAK